jgi:hypothetical protein
MPTGALCKRWAVAIYVPTVSRVVKFCGSVALLARIENYPDGPVRELRRFSLRRRAGTGPRSLKVEQLPSTPSRRTNEKWPPQRNGHSCVGKLLDGSTSSGTAARSQGAPRAVPSNITVAPPSGTPAPVPGPKPVAMAPFAALAGNDVTNICAAATLPRAFAIRTSWQLAQVPLVLVKLKVI